MSDPHPEYKNGAQPPRHRPPREMALLVLAALGVVYGDIGTSPLYSVRECFNPDHGIALTDSNVFGVLSLIFWSLTLVVTIKYLYVVLRADNESEGGIMALMSLAAARAREKGGFLNTRTVFVLGLCGTALLVADGMITPSISVLSAVEGLEIATPLFSPYVVPATVAILVGLFIVQRHGTTAIGSVFGPLMLVWFLTIAIVAVPWIIREPSVLTAVDPRCAIRFFVENRWMGLLVMGAVVLCVTGCEALYADMGHFGRRPITIAWQYLVFPCVMINYFGQGAVLLLQPEESARNPFYALSPSWFLIPFVVLATLATVIASQALISGMFSMARQAIQLDLFPRLTIVHTSEKIHGQIYIPEVNNFLAIACVALVIGFRDSSGLAAAYGIAVVGTMGITSLLMYAVERHYWKWSRFQAITATTAFVLLDLFFLFGNVAKIKHGGWFPIAAGTAILLILWTWHQGNRVMTRQAMEAAIPLDEFIRGIGGEKIPRVDGTAVFLMSYPDIVPRSLLHHLKHNKVLHSQIMLLYVAVEGVPAVPSSRRLKLESLGNGFYKAIVSAGFMQNLDMREILRLCETMGPSITGDVSYYIGHVTLRTTGRTEMRQWRKELFAFLFNNERSKTIPLGIPPNRVVELGEQTQI